MALNPRTKREACVSAMGGLVRQLEGLLTDVIGRHTEDPDEQEAVKVVQHFVAHVKAWRPPAETVPTLE